MKTVEGREQTVLVFAAREPDENLARIVLERSGFQVQVCRSVEEMRDHILSTGVVLLAEEALSASGIERLVTKLAEQPRWSEVPFVVLTTGGRSTEHSIRRSHMLARLGHITLLERPIRTATLIASIRAALSSRMRQYEVRNQLEELARQSDDLGRSNAALEQFAYAAAHDLKEPIRNVSLYTQMLIESCAGSLPKEVRPFAQQIVESTERMQNLLDDLLSYTRSVHKPDDEPTEADTEGVLNQVLEGMRSVLEQNRAVVKRGTLPRVSAFPAHLYQLLQNLVSNAIKYRKAEPPVIEISAVREAEEWHFCVQDNGIGIAEEFQERIFGVFKRLHGRDIPGTGMGLAICQRIVNHYGGRIWAVSSLGSGTAIHFTLPAGNAMHV